MIACGTVVTRQAQKIAKKFKIPTVLAVVKPLSCTIWCKPGEAIYTAGIAVAVVYMQIISDKT